MCFDLERKNEILMITLSFKYIVHLNIFILIMYIYILLHKLKQYPFIFMH